MKSIPISKFADLGFCELKIVYHFLEERKPAFHPCVFAGGRQHSVSAGEDVLKPRVAVSLEELLEAVRDWGSVVEFPSESVRVEFMSHGFLFCGRLDKLVKEGRKAIVIDEKFTSSGGSTLFREKHFIQLNAYCNGLLNGRTIVSGVELGERVFAGLQLEGRLVERDIESRVLLCEPRSIGFDEARLHGLLERFAEIMRGGLDGRELACGEPGRCAACEYRLGCAHRAF